MNKNSDPHFLEDCNSLPEFAGRIATEMVYQHIRRHGWKILIQSVAIATAMTILLSSCSYKRLGDLNMISTRNIDSSQEYKLLQRQVESKAKIKKGQAISQAVDGCVNQLPTGEFLMNAAIFTNGHKIKIIGDVYGIMPIAD